MEHVENRLKAIISDFSNVDMNRLQTATCICTDLGIDGEDAHDLIKKIERSFDIKLSRKEIGKYFGAEVSFFPLGALATLLGWRPIRIESLTIGMLTEIVGKEIVDRKS